MFQIACKIRMALMAKFKNIGKYTASDNPAYLIGFI